MGKRGPKPKKLIETEWSAKLAYAIGLITADGCLLSDGLLVDMTSKDKEQLKNYLECLGIKIKIGIKTNGSGKKSFRVQIKNRLFYDFLLSIGLKPKKSLILQKLNVRNEYFFDFLRGYFDGDGSSYSYWDPRWKSSYMFYIGFASGSKEFILWVRSELQNRLNINGHITWSKNKKYCQLKYAKKEAMAVIKKMYYNVSVVCLSRKRNKIFKTLNINKQRKIFLTK